MDDKKYIREQSDPALEKFAQKKKKRKKVFKYAGIIGALALIIVFTVVCFVFFFKVSTVEVVGESKYSEDLIVIKSGITAGENLFSYSQNEIEEILMLNFPYISSVKLSRRIPDKIILKITEDKPEFITEFYGERLILSSGARILEHTEKTADETELCFIKLPDIDRALVGTAPVFSDSADYVKEVLSAVKDSELGDSITYIDLKSKFNIYFLIDTRYKVKCGSNSDFDAKLDVTARILKSGHIPTGVKAEINVSNPDECSAVIGEGAVIV